MLSLLIFSERTINLWHELRMDCSKVYLLHRYHKILDKFYWSRYLDSATQLVMWIDYSIIIKLTEKIKYWAPIFEVATKQYMIAWFSILLAAVLSSITWQMTLIMIVVRLLKMISWHPKLINSWELNSRSDNCTTQYKSKCVAHMLLKIVKEYNIQTN